MLSLSEIRSFLEMLPVGREVTTTEPPTNHVEKRSVANWGKVTLRGISTTVHVY